MANEQPEIPAEALHEPDRTRDHWNDPLGWMKVSTYTLLELSEEEMERVAGALSSGLKIDTRD